VTATISPIPSIWAALDEALRARRPVWVAYHGHERLLCPHALGYKADRAILLAYQSGGHTTAGTLSPDPRKRWRCLSLEDIEHVLTADPACRWQSAENYDPQRPFSAADEIIVAVTSNGPSGLS
jgi:hypothetical protein